MFYVCADIIDRHEYFIGTNISWARIFHGREYFMSANILSANILMCADNLHVSKYFDRRRYFEMCAYIFD